MGQVDEVDLPPVNLNKNNNNNNNNITPDSQPQPNLQPQPQQMPPQPYLMQGQQPQQQPIYVLSGPNNTPTYVQYVYPPNFPLPQRGSGAPQIQQLPPQAQSYPVQLQGPVQGQGQGQGQGQEQQPPLYYQYPNPQIIYVQAPPQVFQQNPNGPQIVYGFRGNASGPGNNLALASLILFLISFFGFWFSTLPSVILSLMMVSKRIIPKRRRAAVIACSVFELIGWVFLPCFVWYGGDYTYYDGYELEISYMWWGWIAIVVYFVFLICFGIPRTVYTFAARNNLPEPK